MEPKKSGSKPEAHCFVPKKTRALALGNFINARTRRKFFSNATPALTVLIRNCGTYDFV
jgi:hypothetical protein